ncbi:MAG TPA: ATP-binding cassette domain-containing protein [Candidatus Saccharimonadales bacterium]|nr:ATP-binding cassette domain-containing protein [Candidatus Saccharimonadales bacterium]
MNDQPIPKLSQSNNDTTPSPQAHTTPPQQPTPPSQSSIVVDIKNLTKRFGKVAAVNNLSLNLVQGEVFGLLGPNGSGKTTTINMISGLSKPTSGEVTIMGQNIARNPRQVRSVLGFVPQETALYEELSAWQNMDFHADIFSVPRKEKSQRITALLALVQLLDHKDNIVKTFSGGMKRRLAIARALLHDPKLIYLDEPTIGVDVQARNVIWEYIRKLRGQGKTVLITTNYLEEAEALCDRLAIIDHGHLITVETTARLKELYGGSIIEIDTVHPELAIAALKPLNKNIYLEADGSKLKISSKGQDELITAIVNIVSRQGGIRNISMRESNLDEIFLKLTGKALRD